MATWRTMWLKQGCGRPLLSQSNRVPAIVNTAINPHSKESRMSSE
jgi:hypothetical protein